MNKKYKKKLGRFGEWRARMYLRIKGYTIVRHNFYNPFGEIDIIASKGDVLAFVEIKTRTNDKYGSPKEAVNSTKMQRYKMGANYFLANRFVDKTIRFDVIEVYTFKIEHIINAFY